MTTAITDSTLGAINGMAAASGSQRSAELRDNFMTLLITQLRNQDPLNPMENAEMTSQLAQINTVSGIEQLNDTLAAITGQINAGQTLEAAGLIGKGVMVPGDRVVLGTDETGQRLATPFGVELEAPADNVQVTVTDGSGQVVSRYDLGAVGAGVSSFTWDGSAGEAGSAVDGAYRIRVEATSEGEPVAASTLNYAVVGGVIPADDSGGVRLDLGAVYGQVGIDEIKQIL